MPAIYYSYINATQLERGMIEKCLEREKIMEGLKALIVRMDLSQDDPTEDQLFQSFKSFILLRNSTVALLKAIQEWQQTFTNLKRPQLMEKDYLVGMISDSDYFSNSKARKYLNFMIGRGNPLLLPRSMAVNAGKPVPPKVVSKKLADLIFKFVNADHDDIRNSYQVFVDSLSPFQYKKLYSATAWLTGEAWMPYIDIKGIPRGSPAIPPTSRRSTLVSEKNSGKMSDATKLESELAQDSSEADSQELHEDAILSTADAKEGNDSFVEIVRDQSEKIQTTFAANSIDVGSQPTSSATSSSMNRKTGANEKKSSATSEEKISSKSGNGRSSMKTIKESIDEVTEDEKPMREKKVSTKAATHVARYQDDTLLSLDARVAKMKVSTGALKEWFESDMKETFLASPANGKNKPKSPTGASRSRAGMR